MNKTILQIFTAILALGLFCGAATATTANFSANPINGALPLNVTFTDQSTELPANATWQWDFDNNGIVDSTEQNPKYTYASEGSYTVTLAAGYGNDTDTETKGNYITVSVPADSVAAFEANVTKGSVPLTVFFTDKSTGAVSRQWNFGDESSNSTEQNPTHTYTTANTYTVTLTVTDANGTPKTTTGFIEVTSGTNNSSGDRIWKEGMPTTYTWNAQSYSGFYYDLNSGVSSENMTITDIDRSIDSGNIEYVTKPTETDFEYSSWGTYQIIGFMAEKYFAGYTAAGSKVIEDNISPISDGILSKILIDSDDKKSANSGDALALEEGYSLNIVEVDINGDSVWVQLEKDGEVVDEGFVSSGDDYKYEADLGEAEDIPIIIVHFGTVFAGTETSAVFIQGLFQVSDEYVELTNGDTFGEMEVTSLSSSEIKMKNEDSIGLDEGDIVDLMGKVKLQVADDSILRFAPILDTSESGTYELRGTVYDKSAANPVTTWTPSNFEGFYYNIDEGIGTESLTIEELGDRDIPSGKLVYKSEPQPVEFEHDEWGNFTVVGFMADKYFAGYGDEAVEGEVDDVSLLSDNILCKVLTDSDDKESMNSGSALVLEEGYSLNIKEVDVNGESVWVQLEKDGEVVDEGFVTSGDDYVYKTDLGEAEDIPLIIVHFGTVFSGTETSAVFVQGIFQLSDDYTEIINGDTFGEMEVSSVSESGITMKNDDDIGLGQDETAEVMGNISFKTADDSTLRFYPFVQVEAGGNASNALKINVPDEIYAGETFNIEVTAGDEPVEAATITVNETSEGETDADGILEYKAEDVGALKITAEKEDYTKATKSINVNPPKEQMSLNISPETVYAGDTITIEALKKIGGDPVEGANVSVDGKAFGETGSDGKITYKTGESGTIKVSVTKEGFADENINLKVKALEAIFKVSNMVVDPIEVSAGKNTTISANIENIGNAAGEYNAELSVNESVVDSQNITLGIGENTTVTFEHSEEVPGTYNAVIGEEVAAYTVKEKSSVLLYVLGVVALLIIGGVAYFFTKGGGDIEMLQQKVQEIISSVKLKK
jgi:S-layer protein (TIGR01567 family)